MDPATGAIGSLLPKLEELLGDKLRKSARKEVVFLKEELTRIQLALSDLEDVPADQLNSRIKGWARQARDLSYDIEHAVDKFLARRLRAADPPAADPSEIFGKISSKMSITKASARFATDIGSFRQPIMELGGRPDRPNVAAPRAAGELADPAGELVDLDARVEELVKILTEEKEQGPLKVASILGRAGVGKTTLANQVYQRLHRQFKCTAWVTVSPKPDIKNVLWTMLCQISPQDHDGFGSFNVEETIGEIRKALMHKRYFIVVEDMWDVKVWETIKSALIEDGNRSAVLMTTCKVSIARSAGIYRLRPLPKNSSRKLFYRRLFGSGDSCPPELADISEKILEKCNGVPSAIIKAANLLAGKTQEDWHTVLESNNLADSYDTRSRYLSYTGVPRHLKSCLLYLSMFQKGYEIIVDRLIWGWIAEGFIPEHAGTTVQQLGEEYFSELMERKLIEAVEVDAGGKALSCRVNDTGHDLIVSLSTEESSVTIFNGRQGRPLPQTVGRLAIRGNNLDLPTQVRLSSVRSLVVSGDANLFSEESSGTKLMSSFSKFENLRVLELGGCDSLQSDHLKGIGSLHLLRYLVIGGNCITDVPKDIGYLVFLQTLDLRATSVKELPGSIVHAKQLKCLRVNRHTKMPHGIGKMKALEELGDMNISNPNLLKELCELTDLRVLRIVIWSWDDSYDDALLSYLGSLSRQNIKSLSILTCCSLHVLDDLDAGQTPPSLKKLEIRHSAFLSLPGWICSLERLSSLSIEVYKLSQEIIDILGRLQNLLVLSLTSKHVPEGNFNDGFRNLTCFHFLSNAVGRIFGPGAMLNLKRLDLSFQASHTKDVFHGFDFGLENLSSLEHLSIEIICFNANLRVVEDAKDAIRRAIYRGRSRGANLVINRVREDGIIETAKEEDVIESEKEQEDMIENEEEEETVMKQQKQKETKKMKKLRVAKKKFRQKEKGTIRKYKIVSLHLRSQTLTASSLILQACK